MNRRDVSDVLRCELVMAMGCTEPAACALAGAKAATLLEGWPTSVVVRTTRDVVKNAMGVSIPGFHKKGVGAAVALGVAVRDVFRGLDILSCLTEEQKRTADGLSVDVRLVEETVPLYIRVELTGMGHSSVAVVSGSHTNFSYLECDGRVLREESEIVPEREGVDLSWMTVGDVIAYAASMPKEIETLLLDAASTNLKIARQSLSGPYGLAVGKTLMKDLHEPPENLQEALDVGAALAAGGSDARMAGCQMPVVVNSGSGNQGLVLTVPLAVIAGYLKKCPTETAEALCMAELVGLVLTSYKGRLSAQCGAFTAAIGMGCGLAWLQGGDEAALERVIQNMVGDLAGVICDGAKMTCALKIHSCVQSAYLASKLALQGIAPTPECGIIGEDAKKTMGNLSRLTHGGMEPTDRTILSIMMGKQAENGDG